MSLRARLALVVGGLVAVAVGFGAFGAFVVVERQLRGEIDSFLRDRSERIAGPEQDGDSPVISQPAPRRGGAGRALADLDAEAQIIGPNGRVLMAVSNVERLPIDESDVALARTAGP